MSGRHPRIHASLLVLLLIGGTMGAPLIGPLRETLQELMGVSRAQLGLWINLMGLGAGALSLWATVRFRGTLSRTSFIKLGTVCGLAGMVLFAAVRPSPGAALWGMAAGWFLVTVSNVVRAVSGPIFMDLWRHAPHTGVLLLHGVNAVGKVVAPLIVLLVGESLQVNAGIYAAALLLLALDMCTWPKQSVRELGEAERSQLATTESVDRSWRGALFWTAALQFAFIAGSEAGVVSILGSFLTHHRSSPIVALSPARWAAAVLVLSQMGIFAGRFVFAGFPALKEKTVVLLCLLCGVFVLPGVLSPSPWVYVSSLFMVGVTFSATYPAFFTLSARSFVANRTAYSMATGLTTQVGINLCIWLASVLGNRQESLPVAVIASTAVMGLFGLFLFATRTGRQLCRAAEPATVPE
ncbi:MAG: hypothetical protein COZ06_16935 [Armatimonadetes bacterium CG_4_10_14_3_um_filter_66_18]|nr:hypothetical protein [Armatimonadota bacterium]PIU91873.1 MAG: hypothetical protein COS65_20610 [Armatimonadetes bacterium CG06_land_8_20_14_3_00_66_21]PIX37296.1 MAG: hypothetical protein COZ57_35075 [Armatimonadetes bacterium CG_4_8_14_3_um_filter_66_20]PIY48242.1 MAG: hypothetical protein COZ06_16935 [Armatimonadetes bacterium CG_4_10_14_3_um_filter_66_18]PIZ47742.1 MAG: hypothetical protein COY42_07795 [Armatimonadetes bacterium CG_4_10_14_0_8_um_filter_66_14]PJB71135.1 MAG: hypothetica